MKGNYIQQAVITQKAVVTHEGLYEHMKACNYTKQAVDTQNGL